MNSNASQPAIHDTLIIGGGPAGLTAALYLGRALRSTLVIDAESAGRSSWVQHNHNYPGFPEGIQIQDLVRRCKEQAQRYGASFLTGLVTSLEQLSTDHFTARVNGHSCHGRTVLIATGVTDRWVEFPGSAAFIGRSMHWCAVCDGYEMRGQRVLVVGNSPTAALEASQLKRFTSTVSILVDPDNHTLSKADLEGLARFGVKLHYGRIARASQSGPGMCAGIVTTQGEELAVDHIFSMLGSTPNTGFATNLGPAMNTDGFVTVDTEARTSCPGVFAAGDVTRLFSHQVVTAAHEGATAAMAIAHDLWQDDNS
jgi:thioredoxin reductase (NADPH)